nr:tail fiber assembly protein [uncultured Pseudomonas sp.]
MNRYVLIELVYKQSYSAVVLQVVDAEEFPSVPGNWMNVPQDTAVQVGWVAQFTGAFQWVFTEPAYEDYVRLATARMQQGFDEAAQWLTFNPLQYKVDIGVATPADEAALLAYKQYVVAVSEVKNQPGYPLTINWPVVPF